LNRLAITTMTGLVDTVRDGELVHLRA